MIKSNYLKCLENFKAVTNRISKVSVLDWASARKLLMFTMERLQ